jgi:NAD-dependent deacetylase
VSESPTPSRSESAGEAEAGAPFDEPAVARARDLVAAARRIVALTGAGISTESGIPDFRGPDGVWTRDPEAEKYSTIGHYLSDPDIRRRAWRHRLGNPAWTAEPNAGHRALVDLAATGHLDLVVTQNIDGLHQAAGSDPSTVVEVHGSIREVHCVGCAWRGPMAPVLERVRAGEEDPPCPECGGIVKSTTVFFGEQLPADALDRAFAAAASCDLLLAVGTTLSVYPVARMVPIASASGSHIVIVNGGPTDMDEAADVVVRGRIGDVLPCLVP